MSFRHPGRGAIATRMITLALAMAVAGHTPALGQAKVLSHSSTSSSAKKSAAAKPAATSKATSASPSRTGLESLEKQVQTFTLANGLRVIVIERHQAPVFSYSAVVNAGSADDQVGTTGLAHMMEHMAFKGTEVIGTTDYGAEKTALAAEEQAWERLLDERRKGAKADTAKIASLNRAFKDAQLAANRFVVSNEATKLIEQAGGQGINAFTANDITAYFYSLPSNRLEYWAAMQAGTFVHPVFREFYKERDVVYEERRMRTESSPFGRLFEEFTNAAYVAHPYGFGGIGHPSDLKSFSRTEGEEFFKSHYVAKNMCVAVVGDVTLPDVKRVAETYFGEISSAPAPPPLDTVEPEQKAERRVILEEASQPIVVIGWHCPAASDPRYAATKALADLLAGGDWARLNKVLVKEKKIAAEVQVFTGYPGEKYPGLITLILVPASGQDPLAVEQAAYAVIDSIQTKAPFTADEVKGYKVRMKAQKIGAASSNANLAGELSQAEIIYGGWQQFFREQERTQSLTPADVMNAMSTMLVRHNRTVAMIVNPKPAASEGGR